MHSRSTNLLLNIGHAIDHMFLLIFATAVTTIAREFGLTRWEDLMPYSAAAFFFFGVGALPSGKLGDQWGRRSMMLLFFFGMGVAALIVAAPFLVIALGLGWMGARRMALSNLEPWRTWRQVKRDVREVTRAGA